jgi:ABC-type nitrate/sulfonate/bicarbonate transport system permease component
MAGIVTIGLLGLFFDILLRAARRMLFSYLESND